jgi:hypothetical protein
MADGAVVERSAWRNIYDEDVSENSARQRVDFTAGVVRDVARRAMYVCSNPGCLRVTGFQTTKGRPRAIAQAAHILPAAKKGPRRDVAVRLPDGTELKQGDEGNAIWLCLGCHYRVDADAEAFPADLLLAWKRDHQERVSSLVGLDLEQSLLRLGGERMSHDLAQDLLLWLDGHRFMYFPDSREFPDYVWGAVGALRLKLIDMRTRVYDGDSSFGRVLVGIDAAVSTFVAELNDIRVDDIVVKSGDPDFEFFSESLRQLRRDIATLIVPLAQNEGFEFQNIGRW